MDKTITIKLTPYQCAVMQHGAYFFDKNEFSDRTEEELKFWDIKFIKRGKEFDPNAIEDTLFGKNRLTDLNFTALSKSPNKNELACSIIVPKSKELLRSIISMVDIQYEHNLDTYDTDTDELRVARIFTRFDEKLKKLFEELFESDPNLP